MNRGSEKSNAFGWLPAFSGTGAGLAACRDIAGHYKNRGNEIKMRRRAEVPGAEAESAGETAGSSATAFRLGRGRFGTMMTAFHFCMAASPGIILRKSGCGNRYNQQKK
jgi:hypothetical protein